MNYKFVFMIIVETNFKVDSYNIDFYYGNRIQLRFMRTCKNDNKLINNNMSQKY